MKNSLETFNSRFEYTEDRIAKLEDRSIDSIQSEKEKEKKTKKKLNKPQGRVRYHQAYQHVHNASLRRKKESERNRKKYLKKYV